MEVKATPKPWYQSKTLVLNGIILVASAAVAMLTVLQGTPEPYTTTTVIAAVIAGLNVVLRFTTNQPIGRGQPAGQD